MNENVKNLIELLNVLVGVHRRLLELVRRERDVLIEGNIKDIQELTFSKEALISSVQQVEARRIHECKILAGVWKLPPEKMTISEVIFHLQENDLSTADQIRSIFTALNVLINRIKEQNLSNKSFVEESLKHIRKMKENIMGESRTQVQTYTQQGRKKTSPDGAHQIISKEV